MLGFSSPDMHELMRLYVTIHSDHEGGNVASACNPYLSFAAALNGLAGPLHGLANQEVLLWIKSVVEECGENISKEQLKDYVWKTLNSGKARPWFWAWSSAQDWIQDIHTERVCYEAFA
ncbi:hypothetical protein HAX54_038822 [Datura stramonium]|uniref:Citrate synthase n=1 Tax=Datura stramonium TaxID=4076 RepID=A0ABS8SIQ6_DATST|nr:hypothetical protein [Datura stramonium]